MKLHIWILSLVMFLLMGIASYAQVRVRGYTRSNGTYVAPHYRSNPDGKFLNNWSTKGNVNPYNGKEGIKINPDIKSPVYNTKLDSSHYITTYPLSICDYSIIPKYYYSAIPKLDPRIAFLDKDNNIRFVQVNIPVVTTPIIPKATTLYTIDEDHWGPGSTKEDVLKFEGRPEKVDNWGTDIDKNGRWIKNTDEWSYPNRGTIRFKNNVVDHIYDPNKVFQHIDGPREYK